MTRIDPGMLTRKLDVQRLERVSDGQGGYAESWRSTAQGVRGTVAFPRFPQKVMARGGQQQVDVTHVVHMSGTRDVRRGDRIDLGDGEYIEVGTRHVLGDGDTRLRCFEHQPQRTL